MAILVFQHHRLERPSRLGAILTEYSHRLNVCELHEGDEPPVDLDDIDAVISLGGPVSAEEIDQWPKMASEMELLRRAHEARIPVVGISLGAQLIAKALGGDVTAMDQPEIGWHSIEQSFPGTIDPIFSGIPWQSRPFHFHADEVVALPEDATGLANSAVCRHQAFKVGLKTYAFQYHFEWDRADIEAVLNHYTELLEKADVTADELRHSAHEHYQLHRHLGERLCHNIAGLLMPVDKR